MKKIIGIACVDRNGFYAPKEGGPLAWPHTEGDLDWFKFQTNGGIVVVGDNTYKELQKLPPLKNRLVWPVGKNHELKTVDDVLEKFDSNNVPNRLFVAGGGALWEGFRAHYDNFYLTVLKKQWITDGLEIPAVMSHSKLIITHDKYDIYYKDLPVYDLP